ncbi:MAG: DUF305 domain-containing protein [Ilumatobacteraceae bacterium]
MVDTSTPDPTAEREEDQPGDDGDDSIVLPWWQHPLNIVTLLVAGALVGAMIGWLVADARSGPASSDVDVGFLQDMREHHEQALAMSFIYLDLPDTEPGLRVVARGITMGQGIEIGRMIQMLRDMDADEANLGDTAMTWMGMSSEVGAMPGMASSAELDELSTAAGAEADRLYVELMTEHHIGGIEMAEYAAQNATNAEVRAMATGMVDGQLGEIVEMRQLLD